jgi:hypothetical protein
LREESSFPSAINLDRGKRAVGGEVLAPETWTATEVKVLKRPPRRWEPEDSPHEIALLKWGIEG